MSNQQITNCCGLNSFISAIRSIVLKPLAFKTFLVESFTVISVWTSSSPVVKAQFTFK